MANAYGCLEPHTLYGVQASKDITEEDIQHGIHQIMDPWEQGPNYENAICEWCLKHGHHTIQCHQLMQCKLCLGCGHSKDQCHYPHKYCKAAFLCQVHLDHPRLHHACHS
jgi:hypothetical protein